MYAGHFDFTVPLVQRVPDVWSAEQCAALVARVEDQPWMLATVNGARGRVVQERLRNNDVCVLGDAALADDFFASVRPHLPAAMHADWDGKRARVELAGLFLPLRVYRYVPGQHFGLHEDQSYARGDARSLLTLLLYLDDDCDGGETDFPQQDIRVAPRRGDALWFQHRVLHAGRPVTRGVKHVLRGDVLYRR
jgi:predicted 2-oxoglutarate/Fe(II)-dependent dioxygenase YbiX